MIRGDQFTQRAQMQAEQGNNLVNMLQGLMQDRRKQQMLEQEMQMKREADLNAARKEALKPENVLMNEYIAQGMTPEQASIQAFNTMEGSKVVQDAITGELRQARTPIGLPGMRPELAAIMGSSLRVGKLCLLCVLSFRPLWAAAFLQCLRGSLMRAC
jgi:hypothetical protein